MTATEARRITELNCPPDFSDADILTWLESVREEIANRAGDGRRTVYLVHPLFDDNDPFKPDRRQWDAVSAALAADGFRVETLTQNFGPGRGGAVISW